MRILISLMLLFALSACSGISRDNAKTLGNAGVLAMQAIHDQTYQAQQTLGYLPELSVLSKVLACRDVDPKRLDGSTNLRKHCIENAKSDEKYNSSIDQISKVLDKRIVAVNDFIKAYQSYTDLATYDAGAEFKSNFSALCGGVDALAKSAAALDPAINAVPLACDGLVGTLGGVGGVFATLNQEDQLRSASPPLKEATSAFSKALAAEEVAMNNLLDYLVQEKSYAYQQLLGAGLIDSEDPLIALLSQIAPGAKLKAGVPADEADLVVGAAQKAVDAQAKRDKATIVQTYDAALSALTALIDQHNKLEAKQPLDISTVLAKADQLETLLNSGKAPPPAAK